MKLYFSGHESFICKHFWLKKGYDFIKGKGNFNEEAAVVDLGVGKNMVISISYWLKAFGITDDSSKLSELGDFIFNDETGIDPYIEDLGTIWLLHSFLIKTARASIYSLIFNEFRKGRLDFTRNQLLSFIKRKIEDSNQSNFNENTVTTDISVFIRNYLRPNYQESKIDIEEDFSNLMTDLDLLKLQKTETTDGKTVDRYQIENSLRPELPYQIVLFSILDNEAFSKSVSFQDLLSGQNSPGTLFALNDDGLYKKIEMIVSNYKDIVFTETAGVRELQFKKKPNKWHVLHEYYKN